MKLPTRKILLAAIAVLCLLGIIWFNLWRNKNMPVIENTPTSTATGVLVTATLPPTPLVPIVISPTPTIPPTWTPAPDLPTPTLVPEIEPTATQTPEVVPTPISEERRGGFFYDIKYGDNLSYLSCNVYLTCYLGPPINKMSYQFIYDENVELGYLNKGDNINIVFSDTHLWLPELYFDKLTGELK